MSNGKPSELIFYDHIPMEGRGIASEKERGRGCVHSSIKGNLSFINSLFRKGKNDFTLLEE